MIQTSMTEQLLQAEGLMVQGLYEGAYEILARLAEDAEEYVDRNCPTTDEQQWFTFPTLFERLAYRRVEGDPRELLDIGEPLDRLYADLAVATLNHTGDYDACSTALKQAIRWNPMDCGYRLDLAELRHAMGDERECLGLSYSVLERASDARHLARAFLNFARYFAAVGNPRVAAAALRAARRLGVRDGSLAAMLDQAAGTERDPDQLSDDEADDILEAEGLPTGANVDVAICLLMCATDAARLGDRNTATTLTMRARDLVGEQAAMALVELIRSTDDAPDDDAPTAAATDDAAATDA